MRLLVFLPGTVLMHPGAIGLIRAATQITYPQIPLDVRARIKSIVVPEFGGIDHLSDNSQALLTYET